jgi:hypothetical protein
MQQTSVAAPGLATMEVVRCDIVDGACLSMLPLLLSRCRVLAV